MGFWSSSVCFSVVAVERLEVGGAHARRLPHGLARLHLCAELGRRDRVQTGVEGGARIVDGLGERRQVDRAVRRGVRADGSAAVARTPPRRDRRCAGVLRSAAGEIAGAAGARAGAAEASAVVVVT